MRLALLVGCVVVTGACGARSNLEPGEPGSSGSTTVAGTHASGGASGMRPSTSAGRAGMGAGGAATSGGAAGRGGSAIGGAGAVAGTGQSGAGGEAGEPCQADGRAEVCNGIDDDCNGVVDDGLPLVADPGPITVRDDEGRTDVGLGLDCDSCGWAWDPQLVETDAGLGVLWFLGIWGGKEQPSVFHRRYGPGGDPLNAVSLLGSEYWMAGLRRGTPEQNGALLTLVERVGREDVSSFTFIDRRMSVRTAVPLDGCPQPGFIHGLSPLAPGLVSCIGDGSIHLFGLDESRGAIIQRLDHLFGETGTSAAGAAHAALRGERGLVAVPIRPGGNGFSNVLWTLEVSASGAPLSGDQRQQLDELDNVLLEGLFATDDGYLLFGHSYNMGASPQARFVIPLAANGSIAGPALHYTDPKQSYWDDISIARDGAGFIAVTSQEYKGLTVKQLDASGKVWNEVASLAAAYSPPSLLFSRGHLYVAFTEPPTDGDENRVLLQRFSCIR